MKIFNVIIVSLLFTFSQIVFAEGINIHVHKSEFCGCCSKWVDHMDANGFHTSFSNEEDMSAIKDDLNISHQIRSCHTAVVQQDGKDYFFEGHISASVVEQFLIEPPENAVGLSVPGMPIGSPGMEMGDRIADYNVLVVFNDGTMRVYEAIEGNDG